MTFVGGGGIGRATGGCFFPHAIAHMTATSITINPTRLIVVSTSPFSNAQLTNSPTHALTNSPIHFDQSGMKLFPTFVICRRFWPVREIVKICDLPDRVDMKARCRPFADHVGLSLVPSPKVS